MYRPPPPHEAVTPTSIMGGRASSAFSYTDLLVDFNRESRLLNNVYGSAIDVVGADTA